MMSLPQHRIEPGGEVISSPSLNSKIQEAASKPSRDAVVDSTFGDYNPHWEGDLSSRPLKVGVIREEFVALTGDALIAVVLNQLFYWTQRVKDFDLLLEEEKKYQPECNVILRHGWIYKSAEDLIGETLLRVSRSTMRRYLNFLVDKGWVDERANPSARWDKTTQYRLNLRKLQNDLNSLGYCLPGFHLGGCFSRTSIHSAQDSIDLSKPAEIPNGQNETSMFQNERSKDQNETSNVQNCSFIYLNRDYTEIKNREHTTRAHEDFENSFFEEALKTWKTHVGQEALLTEQRKHQLKLLLSLHFQNDLSQWELFCKRIKSSPFLMGQGARKWHVTLDWILAEGNLLKVLEGNFDDPQVLEKEKSENANTNREQKIEEILAGIEDPVWKYWCSQLASFSGGAFCRTPLRVSELAVIAQARFLEIEDDRLVWIGSSDPEVLDHIENLRLELLSIVQRTYPNVRNIRTRLDEDALSPPPSLLFMMNTSKSKETNHA